MSKQRSIRHKRIRAKIKGTARAPRLCVFRSNKHIYAQLIDDERGKTLVSVSDSELKQKNRKTKEPKDQQPEKPLTGKVGIAYEVGRLLAKKSLEKKIGKAVFDRGGYKYHGRVKAVAEGAREGGLQF